MTEESQELAKSAIGPASDRSGKFRTFASFRHREYRLLWFGLLFGVTGWWMQTVAMGWLVLQITDSPFWLGIVSAAASVPQLAFSLLGGAAADRVDRRKLLIFTRTALALLVFLIAFLIFAGTVEVWHVMVISVFAGILFAFDIPARQAMIPTLVEPEDLMNAISLSSAVINVAAIIGPAIAGFLVAFFGVGGVFVLVGLGYLGLVAVLLIMKVPAATGDNKESVLKNIIAGLNHLRNTGSLALLMLVYIFVNVVGGPYQTLMPVFARDVLAVGSSGLGLMMSAAGAGALVSSLGLASLGDFRNKGLLLLGTGVVFGLSMAGFSQASFFPLALLCLVGIGAGGASFNTLTTTIVQSATPEDLQGRIMSTFVLVWGLVPIGSIAAGASASVFGAPITITIAGLLVAVFAVAMRYLKPELTRV